MRSKHEGDGGTGVYMWEGTTSRVTAADRPYGEFYGFYSVSPENFGSTHVISGTGVENTLSLTYRHKKKSTGVISGDRGGQGVGTSLPIHMFGNVASKSQMLQMLQ